jgi:hypothetical protein
MAERRTQGLGVAAMSSTSSAHHPVAETDDGNEFEEACIDLESAFANSHESSDSSEEEATEENSGSKCQKILESKLVEAPACHGRRMCQK